MKIDWLPNGTKVIVKEIRSLPVVALQAWIQFGSADEPAEMAGVAHVVEHMLFKGTLRRGVGRIAKEIEAAGGDINAWTSFDETVYHLVLPSSKFTTGLDVLADAVSRPAFDRVELAREIEVVLEEIRQGEDEPGHLCVEELFKTAFVKHPYRRPIIGYRKTVSGLDRKALQQIHKSYYNPANIVFVVAGDVDAKKAMGQIRRKLGGGNKREALKARASEPAQKDIRVKVQTAEVEECYVALGFHVPGLKHPDTPALDLLSVMLGQGESCRLISELKRKAGLLTDAYAYAYSPRDLGLLVVGASMPATKLGKAMEGLFRELYRMCSEDVSSEELAKAIQVVRSDTVYGSETVQGMARKLGYYETMAGDPDYERYYLNAIETVACQDIGLVARKYLVPHNLSISVVHPNKALDDMASSAKASAAKVSKKQVSALVLEAEESARRALDRTTRQEGTTPSSSLRPGPADVYKTRLSSGGTVLVKVMSSVPVVAMRTAWLGGIRTESAKTNGISNMLSGMVTRGTEKRPKDQVFRELEALGGAISAVAGRNSFGFRVESLAGHWAQGLEILADCVLNPTIDPVELDQQRAVVAAEIKAQQDNLTHVTFQLFRRTLYRDHPYAFPMLGTEETVASISADALRAYHQSACRPQDMVLAVCGDVDPSDVFESADSLFKEPSSIKGVEMHGKEPKEVREPLAAHQEKKVQQAHILLGFPGTLLTNPDRFALEVMATILSGQGGRLFIELRDKKSLAYRVFASSLEGLSRGYFAVYMATEPGKTGQAVSGIRKELERLRRRKVSKNELERVKNHMVGSHLISLQRRSSLASSMALNELYGLGYDEYMRYPDNILSVSAEQVIAVARQYLDPDREVMVTVGPR